MKKIFSAIALLLMITSLSACMDAPDAGNKKPANYGSPVQQKG
jgi:predicted small lipoprotein YifL